jgi:hypothetical protein
MRIRSSVTPLAKEAKIFEERDEVPLAKPSAKARVRTALSVVRGDVTSMVRSRVRCEASYSAIDHVCEPFFVNRKTIFPCWASFTDKNGDRPEVRLRKPVKERPAVGEIEGSDRKAHSATTQASRLSTTIVLITARGGKDVTARGGRDAPRLTFR